MKPGKPPVSLNLAQAMADPYNISDTSGGDPRIHAVRRIALAAVALGLDAQATETTATRILGCDRLSTELRTEDLERVAAEMEVAVDDLLCE